MDDILIIPYPRYLWQNSLSGSREQLTPGIEIYRRNLAHTWIELQNNFLVEPGQSQLHLQL
jgi:hypothetical protein